MKFKIIVSCIVVMAFFSFKPAEANATRFNIDRYIRDVSGAVHHVHGWIDVNIFRGRIDHCDIWYDGAHFVMSEDPTLQYGGPNDDYLDGVEPIDESLINSLLDGSYSDLQYDDFQPFQP